MTRLSNGAFLLFILLAFVSTNRSTVFADSYNEDTGAEFESFGEHYFKSDYKREFRDSGSTCFWQQCQSMAHVYKCPASTYVNDQRPCLQKEGEIGTLVFCCTVKS